MISGPSGEQAALSLRERFVHKSISLPIDDGFYYLEIARNVAHGVGSTCSGLEWTNGYHPLWLLVLVPVFWVTDARDTALILSIALQALLMATGAGLGYRIARLTVGRLPATLVVLVWLLLTYRL